MGKDQKPIVFISGVGKRIGLALARYFLNSGIGVIGTYRSHYPELDELEKGGADLYYCDFYQPNSVNKLITAITSNYSSLRAVIHNASDWLPDDCEYKAHDIFEKMVTVHASVPYQLNLAFTSLLKQQAATQKHGDIIHISDYVAAKGSTKHIAYAASKAAMDNLTLSFAAKLAPQVKVNSIAPALIMFNDHDSDSYKQKAIKKSLMEKVAGEAELIATVTYLMQSHYITGRVFPLDGGRHLK